MNRWKLDSIEACMRWMGMIDRVILKLLHSIFAYQALMFGFWIWVWEGLLWWLRLRSSSLWEKTFFFCENESRPYTGILKIIKIGWQVTIGWMWLDQEKWWDDAGWRWGLGLSNFGLYLDWFEVIVLDERLALGLGQDWFGSGWHLDPWIRFRWVGGINDAIHEAR